jgi:thiol-disulfide isomerase/thioredoxin
MLVFGLATYLYSSERADRIEALAAAADSPLERPYSRGMGPADARVVLVEFFDPACETCRAFAPYLKALLAEHRNRVRLVLRYACAFSMFVLVENVQFFAPAFIAHSRIIHPPNS